MTDQEIKIFVSKNILNNIKDQAIQNIIRRVLFNDKNKISWQHFYTVVVDQMPELKNEGTAYQTFIDKILEGVDVRAALSEAENPSEALTKSIYSNLRRLLNNWGVYVGDKEQWIEMVTTIAGDVWDDLN